MTTREACLPKSITWASPGARLFQGLLLLAMLLFGGAPARAYDIAIRNATRWRIRVTLEYVACRMDNSDFIEAGATRRYATGGCLLTDVIIWVEDPACTIATREARILRWNHGGYAGNATWTVNTDGHRLTQDIAFTSLGDLIVDTAKTAGQALLTAGEAAGEWLGQGALDAMKWLSKLKSKYKCPVPAVPFSKHPKAVFQIYTQNCYCFPRGTVDAMQKAKDIGAFFQIKEAGDIPNLQSGIKKPVFQRINEIAAFVKQQDPDVAFFQELWGDQNKEDMVDRLCGAYPYCMYVPSEIPVASMIVMDDGLLLVSKYPFDFESAITFQDRIDDEKLAQKGALFVGMKDRSGRPILLVCTHLQSGTASEAVAVRKKQMMAIGAELVRLLSLRKDFANCRIVVGGDMNDPICYDANERWVVDRTNFLATSLQAGGISLNNDQMLEQIAAGLSAWSILKVDEPTRTGILHNPAMMTIGPISRDDTKVQRLGNPWRGAPFPAATDPDGIQVLDNLLLDDKTRLLRFQVFRQEILGAAGPVSGSDLPPAAISDHAGLLVTLGYK